jgi:hypothetical protein
MILCIDAPTARRIIDGTQTAITVPVTWQNSSINGSSKCSKKTFDWYNWKEAHKCNGIWKLYRPDSPVDFVMDMFYPRLQPGDEILFKEPWALEEVIGHYLDGVESGEIQHTFIYEADFLDLPYYSDSIFKSPHHMPHEAVRLKRTVKSARGVWPKELTFAQCLIEGIDGYWSRGMGKSVEQIKAAYRRDYTIRHPDKWDYPAWRIEI